MVTLNEETSIASPPAEVWPLLRDPAVVAACIPGAELSADEADGVWRGSIRIKFGPTVARFRGEATLAFDDAARRVTIDGRGIDGRGASRALANCVVELHGEETTTLKVQGEFSVTGPLESFVNAGGVHVARALLTEFSSNIANAVAEQHPSTPDAPATETTPPASAPATPPPTVQTQVSAGPVTEKPVARPATSRPTELSGGGLLWRALVGWFKGLFTKGNKNR